MKQVLDLFSGLGGFSQAFEEDNGWGVTAVDIEERFEPDICADVYNLKPGDLPVVDLVLASPPCTLFSTAGNHEEWNHDKKEPIGDRARHHIGLVYHTIGLIHALNPDYWFLENPTGRLSWVLGEPSGIVTYCRYGTDYQKMTGLWGEHPRTFRYLNCPPGGECHINTPSGQVNAVRNMPKDVAERSKVPYGLSKAILEEVEGNNTINDATEW